MRWILIRSIVAVLAMVTCRPAAWAKKSSSQLSNLDRAVAFAIDLEAHANRLEDRPDLCVGFGHGLKVDEKGILTELKRLKLKVHNNDWCNQGPRGLVIAVIAPASESVPGDYELMIELGDLRPIRQHGQHFGTLLRRGTYSVKSKGEPDLVRYQKTCCLDAHAPEPASVDR